LQRRLAAIMAADVVDYSRLMGEDEVHTLAALAELRDVLFEPLVAIRAGNIIKRMGDGWLVEYANVSDAVACAIEIQQGLRNHETIQLRIGVHVGDITSLDHDVYGGGVNVAARLESMAEPGQILISDTVYNSLDGKASQQFEGGEGRKLKNIARTVPVWRWSGGPQAASRPTYLQDGQLDLSEKPSIAVLAFENMSRDPEQEFFSEGITGDIITDLSKVSGLIVIARNSSFSYSKLTQDIRQICVELNVKYILEGSVRRAGDKVRISAQLIDGLTGGHLWADRFDRSLEDIFAIQDEITREIVYALKIALTPTEQTSRKARGKVDPKAYECLIRGRTLHYAFTADALIKSRGFFDGAFVLDSGVSAGFFGGLTTI
jgi:adenylate cyclase